MQRFYVDTNCFITAWYIYYPPSVFASLWEQLVEKKDLIVLIKPIFDEIEKPSSPKELKDNPERFQLRSWLVGNTFPVYEVSDEIRMLSLNLEMKYEVTNFSTGANQNDITLISCSINNDGIVVTYESDQPEKPRKKGKYKIPLICREEGVGCITFVQMLQKLCIRM
jgi:hypothetical protein